MLHNGGGWLCVSRFQRPTHLFEAEGVIVLVEGLDKVGGLFCARGEATRVRGETMQQDVTGGTGGTRPFFAVCAWA